MEVHISQKTLCEFEASLIQESCQEHRGSACLTLHPKPPKEKKTHTLGQSRFLIEVSSPNDSSLCQGDLN